MQRSNRSMTVVVLVISLASLVFSACATTVSSEDYKVIPAHVEYIEGAEFNRVTLTAKAAERLDIQTAQVRNEAINGSQQKVVPYAAVIYGVNGETWVYTNPEPLIFVRDNISIDYVDGDLAVLSAGPANGTEVVTVGVAELYGTDTGVGK